MTCFLTLIHQIVELLQKNCHISDFGINFARIKVRYGIYVKTERRKEV